VKALAVALLSAGFAVAQSNPATDAYERGVQLGNQQNATVVDCLSHPDCIAALQAAQARKDEAEAEKARLKAEAQGRKDEAEAERARLKAEAQARKDAAKAEKQRQKTEIKLAKLRLQTERETAKREALASASQPASVR
jgi:Skp family chaperone for outer membrane proteins